MEGGFRACVRVEMPRRRAIPDNVMYGRRSRLYGTCSRRLTSPSGLLVG